MLSLRVLVGLLIVVTLPLSIATATAAKTMRHTIRTIRTVRRLQQDTPLPSKAPTQTPTITPTNELITTESIKKEGLAAYDMANAIPLLKTMKSKEILYFLNPFTLHSITCKSNKK